MEKKLLPTFKWNISNEDMKKIRLVVLIYFIFYEGRFFFQYGLKGLVNPLVIFHVTTLICTFSMTYIYWNDIKDSFQKLKKNYISTTLLIVLLHIVTRFIIIFVAIRFNLTSTENQDAVEHLIDMQALFFSILIIGFLAPISEEILFRHVMIGKLANQLGLILACILSVTVFTLAHAASFIECLIYLPLSVILAYFYVKNGYSILHSLAFHIFNNFIAVLPITIMLHKNILFFMQK